MKVSNLEEAKAKLEQYAHECQSSPILVTVHGKPAFEMIPIRSDDPECVDRLLAQDAAFRKLLEERRQESDAEKVSSLEEVRTRRGEAP